MHDALHRARVADAGGEAPVNAQSTLDLAQHQQTAVRGHPHGVESGLARDAVRAFAARAMRGRRLACGLIFEPIGPEVESTRLNYRRAIARVFETIIREGIAAGEFREVDVELAGACLVGAFKEGLVGSLAPHAGGIPARTDALTLSRIYVSRPWPGPDVAF